MFDYKDVVSFDEIMLTSASGITNLSNPIQLTNQSGLIEATNQPEALRLDWIGC